MEKIETNKVVFTTDYAGGKRDQSEMKCTCVELTHPGNELYTGADGTTTITVRPYKILILDGKDPVRPSFDPTKIQVVAEDGDEKTFNLQSDGMGGLLALAV